MTAGITAPAVPTCSDITPPAGGVVDGSRPPTGASAVTATTSVLGATNSVLDATAPRGGPTGAARIAQGAPTAGTAPRAVWSPLSPGLPTAGAETANAAAGTRGCPADAADAAAVSAPHAARPTATLSAPEGTRLPVVVCATHHPQSPAPGRLATTPSSTSHPSVTVDPTVGRPPGRRVITSAPSGQGR